MADSSVLVLEPSGALATAEIDSESIGVGPGGKPMRRERLQIGGAALAEIARVKNAAPVAADYALVVRTLLYDAAGNALTVTATRLLVDGSGVTQPVSLAAGVDVTDKDARLLGRAKILDSTGAVIDPALKSQLPAALVGGRLSVDASGVAVPVTDSAGSLTVDAPVGTPVFVRLSDGAAALVGQKVMASSLPVVIASDQGVLGVVGDVDHDAVNTLKNEQIAGHASPVDVPPTLVSAAGDRTRVWVDRAGAVTVRRRKLRESYTAVCRLAETTARLDFTFTHVANTNKQLVTLHHAATATREIRVQKVVVYATLLGTAAGFWLCELRAITGTPATGNPAITPKEHRIGAAATEAVCLVLPTTGGTDATPNSPYGSFIVDHGVESTTPPTAHPLVQGLTGGYPFVLYDASQEDDEVLPLVLRAGTLEGVAIVSRDTAAMVLRAWAIIKYTEEVV